MLVGCSNSDVPANFWKLSDVNWGPLSLMTWSGHPYLAKWLFNLQSASSCPKLLTAWNRYADSPARMSNGLGHRSKKLPFNKYRNSSHRSRFSATTSTTLPVQCPSYPIRCQSKGTRRGRPPRSEACSVHNSCSHTNWDTLCVDRERNVSHDRLCPWEV